MARPFGGFGFRFPGDGAARQVAGGVHGGETLSRRGLKSLNVFWSCFFPSWIHDLKLTLEMARRARAPCSQPAPWETHAMKPESSLMRSERGVEWRSRCLLASIAFVLPF